MSSSYFRSKALSPSWYFNHVCRRISSILIDPHDLFFPGVIGQSGSAEAPVNPCIELSGEDSVETDPFSSEVGLDLLTALKLP